MKYVPGLMVGQLSGKAGSTVASRNKGGSYFRTRVIPKHVVNEATTAVRNNFGSNAQAFRLLQEAQREAWNSLGAQITKKTSLGETIHLSGIQALQMINRNLLSIQADPNYIAPAPASPTPVQTNGLSAASGAPGTTTVVLGANSATQNVTSSADMYPGVVLFFATATVYRTVVSITDATHVVLDDAVSSTTAEVITWTELPALTWSFFSSPVEPGNKVVIECTAPLSAGVSRPSRGQFRRIGIVEPGDTSPATLSQDYYDIFGLITPGAKVFLRATTITTSGFASPQTADFAIAG